MAYPSAIDSYTPPSGTSLLTNPDHAGQHASFGSAITNIENKLGLGSGSAAANQVLVGSGPGTAQWGSVINNLTLGSPTLTGTTIIPAIEGASSHTQFPSVIGEYNNGNSGSSLTIDWSKGDRQLVTISANTTFSYANAIQGQTLTLRVIENSTGGYTITLPTSKWPNGSVGAFGTVANAINLLIVYFDGANYLTQLAPSFA